MARRITLFLAALLFSTSAMAQPRIILDTDFGGDADDLGALAMLLNLSNAGECELLAVISWSAEEYAVPAIHAVNTFYGRPEIPVGVRKVETWRDEWNYTKPIVDVHGNHLSFDDAQDATVLYRQILSRQPEKSVTIVTVGPLANIQNLIESEPDSISPLSGLDLIRRAVDTFVIMGGEFPEGEGEWNFNGYMPGVTRFVLDRLDVPIVFSGFEVGHPMKTGSTMKNLEPDAPLRIGYRHFSEHAPWMKDQFEGEILDNASYDQTAVLYAVRGGVGTWWEIVTGGRVEVDDNGDNRWIPGEPTNQSYLRLIVEPKKVADVIESIMVNDL